METEQETGEDVHYEEEASEENVQSEQEIEQAKYEVTKEAIEQSLEQKNLINLRLNNRGEDRGSFIHGLAVGLGIGCIATFVIMWIAVFFTPLLPSAVTYEAMLSVFIYPLIYLLAVGLIALTAGVVREYYSRRSNF